MARLAGPTRRWVSVALGLFAVVGAVIGLAVATSPGPAHRDGDRSTPAGGSTAPVTQAAVQPVVSVTPDGPVNPATPIIVHVANGTARTVKVTNAKTGTDVTGTLATDATTWTATVPLAYGSTYSVAVDTADTTGAAGHQSLTVATVVPAQTAYPSFIPPPSQTSVGVGQPIVVRFDHAVHDHAAAEAHMHVTASPPQVGSWYWLSDTTAHYRPQTYWKADSTINLETDLYGVDLGHGVFGETDRKETITVHDAWVAKADGATEQMQVFDNGTLVKTMPISLGSPGHPSHIGPHVISDKQPSIVMDSCTYGVCQGQPGYYKETVNLDERISDDGEFVHSAPWSVGSQGGANVSHGCVNLSPANAQWFFDHFGLGDVVEITNSGGPALALSDTYGDWELAWPAWQQGSAL